MNYLKELIAILTTTPHVRLDNFSKMEFSVITESKIKDCPEIMLRLRENSIEYTTWRALNVEVQKLDLERTYPNRRITISEAQAASREYLIEESDQIMKITSFKRIDAAIIGGDLMITYEAPLDERSIVSLKSILAFAKFLRELDLPVLS